MSMLCLMVPDLSALSNGICERTPSCLMVSDSPLLFVAEFSVFPCSGKVGPGHLDGFVQQGAYGICARPIGEMSHSCDGELPEWTAMILIEVRHKTHRP